MQLGQIDLDQIGIEEAIILLRAVTKVYKREFQDDLKVLSYLAEAKTKLQVRLFQTTKEDNNENTY